MKRYNCVYSGKVVFHELKDIRQWSRGDKTLSAYANTWIPQHTTFVILESQGDFRHVLSNVAEGWMLLSQKTLDSWRFCGTES